jgi:hypothetical protein
MNQVIDTYNRHKDHICTKECFDDLLNGPLSNIPLMVEVMTNDEKQQLKKALMEKES